MNRLSMKWQALFVAGILAQGLVSARAAERGNPSEVNMKIYALRVSPNTNCSDSILVFSNASASYQDMVAHPTLGSGPIPNGTYPCVILKISDRITGIVGFDSDSGNCTTGQSKVLDITRGEVTEDPVTGAQTTTAVGEDQVWMYLSTAGSENNEIWRPSSPGLLEAPLIVSDDRVGTFVSDFTNKVWDQATNTPPHANCEIDGPRFSFR